MKKIYVIGLLSLVVLLSVVGAPVIQGDFVFDYDTQKGGYIVYGINRNITEAEIPSFIGGNAVVGVADRAFMQYSNLTKITLPDTITWQARTLQ